MERQRSRRSSSSESPEFEFWMVGNAHPQLEPGLLTADELFVDGVLLPLHVISLSHPESRPKYDPEPEPVSVPKSGPPQPEPEPEAEKAEKKPQESGIPPEASICSSSAVISTSKRWRDIFKVGGGGGDKKKEANEDKKRDRKAAGGGAGGGAAELNINIWPFSRSRSAGTASGGRPKAAVTAAAMRKSSSAPCSRSNSRGESAGGRRWAASPGRPGVHVGRASPVWRGPTGRGGPGREKGRRVMGLNGAGVRGLNLNVNSCIGYGGNQQVRCRGEECERGVGNNNGGGLFRFRALFSKKVY